MENADETNDVENRSLISQSRSATPFSRFEYGVFFLLGVSMLWAWYVSSQGELCCVESARELTNGFNLQEHVPCSGAVLPAPIAVR